MKPLHANLIATAFAATLTARAGVFLDCRFAGNLANSDGPGPSLTDLGTSNGFTTATVDGVPTTVFGFASNTGLSLDVSALPDKNLFTMVALFEFDGAGGFGFARILQTRNFTSDLDGLYWLNSSTWINGNTGPGFAHQFGRFEQVAFVNDHGSLSAYMDGDLQLTVSGDASVSAANLLHFFRDDSPVENSSGQVARLRVFDTALTPAEIGALDRLAPVPEPSDYAVVAGLTLVAFGVWRRR